MPPSLLLGLWRDRRLQGSLGGSHKHHWRTVVSLRTQPQESGQKASPEQRWVTRAGEHQHKAEVGKRTAGPVHVPSPQEFLTLAPWLPQI